MKRTFLLALFAWTVQTAVWADAPVFRYLDLSKTANRGTTQSFEESVQDVQDLQEKNGFKNMPTGFQTFRGIPFQILDPRSNNGHSFVVLKGHHSKDFPEAVSIPAGHLKAAQLFFLHTCRWGGTASNIKIGEYDVVYDDGQVVVIPLHVGAELSNFWYADDTSLSYVAWWNKYKNAEMGVNLFPWKNPRPGVGIQTILFKSLGKMPVPILFAITASDQEMTVSADSPKPEKLSPSDTAHWIPFVPSAGSIRGTALDMSGLLDAPAGKHGAIKADYDKLIFTDGTTARFWGTVLGDNWTGSNASQAVSMAQRLASYGCNLAGLDLSKVSSAPANLTVWVAALKADGIYVCILNPNKIVLSDAIIQDPAVIPAGLLTLDQAKWNDLPTRSGSPLAFHADPMALHPEESLPAQLNLTRSLGAPCGVWWQDNRPNEYLAEAPLLMSAYGVFENWTATLGMKMSGLDWGSELGLDADLSNDPLLLSQWPAASLAYLRGDLKEGRLYVLKSQDPAAADLATRLKSLAHRSGFNPGSHQLLTDPTGGLTAKVKILEKTFLSDTRQIYWQGNVGVIQVDSPRFQTLMGFLGRRKFNNGSWSVETPNLFASISAVSLTREPLTLSSHILITAVTRAENTGAAYNQSKTKLMDKGKGPILIEPLIAKIILHRFKNDPKLKARALDANGHVIPTKIQQKWLKNNLVTGWIPSAFYLEFYK